jgi:hypothetical protein
MNLKNYSIKKILLKEDTNFRVNEPILHKLNTDNQLSVIGNSVLGKPI